MSPLQAAQSEIAVVQTAGISEWVVAGSRSPTAVAPYPKAVAPNGWRRTSHGWEHASSWPLQPRQLGEIIRQQEDREPAWIQLALANLRDVPPLAFALIQIGAIVAILQVEKRRGIKSDRSAEVPDGSSDAPFAELRRSTFR
jgi:hypothetical protein